MKEYFTAHTKVKGGCAAAHGWDSPTFRGPPVRKYAHGFESHTQGPQGLCSSPPANKKGSRLGALFIYWRRGWDSNPRYGHPYA